MRTSALVLLCLALAAVAQAQRCPITAQDISALDLSPIRSACAGLGNPPAADKCDSCAASLFRAFSPLFPKFNLDCNNFPTDPNAANSAITNAITPCISVVLAPLNAAGVPVAQLITLRSCPQQAGPLLTAAAQERCPNLAG